jgi:hypothetical protein
MLSFDAGLLGRRPALRCVVLSLLGTVPWTRLPLFTMKAASFCSLLLVAAYAIRKPDAGPP